MGPMFSGAVYLMNCYGNGLPGLPLQCERSCFERQRFNLDQIANPVARALPGLN